MTTGYSGGRISIGLPPQMLEKLEEHLKETGLTKSEAIRRAIDLYLNSNK